MKLWYFLENEEKVIDINELSLLCIVVYFCKFVCEKMIELELNF